MADNQPTDFDNLKRQASDVITDLHARNLAIPAGVLLVAIIAVMFVLPKSSTPPPPIQTAPVAANAAEQPQLAEAANLTFVSAQPLDASAPEYGSDDPFALKTKPNCRTTKSSFPQEYTCVIGSTVVNYACMKSDESALCKKAAEGATGEAGASGGTGGGGGGTPDPNKQNPDSTPKKKTTTTYYVVDLTFDGKTFKSLVAGDQVPKSGDATVIYAGPNDSAKKAIFVLGDGVSVQGAVADQELGTFELAKGDEVVLTGQDNIAHTLRLSSIRKVTK
ncbi:MAG: hypothetical protein WAP35_07875 [Solirubrobacterales bacterium]